MLGSLSRQLRALPNTRHGPAPSPVGRNLEPRRRQFEAFETKARRHRAADQRPTAGRPRRLPMALGHDALRLLTAQNIGPEPDLAQRPRCGRGNRQDQGLPGMKMSDLDGIDAVPMARLARPQEEIDAGADRPPRPLGHPSLPVPPAFRMALQSQLPDNFLSLIHLLFPNIPAGGSTAQNAIATPVFRTAPLAASRPAPLANRPALAYQPGCITRGPRWNAR